MGDLGVGSRAEQACDFILQAVSERAWSTLVKVELEGGMTCTGDCAEVAKIVEDACKMNL